MRVLLPAEFSVLMTLLSSEDEVLVGNATLCLGNCMEVPQAAASLLRTDIVRVLLKLAARDAQKSTVQLNAGVALGKLCTAEPRCVGLGEARTSRAAVAGTLPTNPAGSPGALVPSCTQVLGPSSCLSEEAFPEGTGEPPVSAPRGKTYLTDVLPVLLPLSSLQSTPILRPPLLSPLLLPLPPTPSPLPLLCPLCFSRKS